MGMLVIEMHERLKPGCENAVRWAARNFGRSGKHGKTLFFVRIEG
jgi:hypothetical protein